MYYSPLYSGSSGNCSIIKMDSGKCVLIDAGLSGKAIFSALSLCDICTDSVVAILITHEHSDHIKGAGIVSRKLDIPIYANEKTWGEILSPNSRIPLGAISEKNVRVFETDKDFFIDKMNILPFSIPHDTVDPVGFSFYEGGRKLSVATDIGHITSHVEEAVSKSDLILIEANHDVDMLKNGSYTYPLKKRILGDRGHLSNENCGKLLAKLYKTGVKRAILGHLSEENNTEAVAKNSVERVLLENDITEKMLPIRVAHRDRVLGVFEV